MADIFAGLTAFKTAFDLAKDLKNAAGAYTDAEMRLKFSELYIALSEAKIELADAQIEMHELKQKVEELQKKLDASDELIFRDAVYWRANEIEGKPNGPFCPKCYESSAKKMSSMSPVSGQFRFAGKYKCNSCGAYVK
ncbi:TPA: hypothetical protein ACW7QV_004058 [Citrobacter braakii]|uniref:hypothetical protein n=1 Tax=Citrobacter TaxID=544 RepID=UPI0015E8F5C1|nr:hypothetical protein [Citrobacter sp. RHBSTW-00903]HCB1436113.1 hypothetical protein [Citrobacter braakii]QLS34487.1 hypothetical protein HV320_10690 [Citrobacter sp. RHBSTW-00903]HCB1479296.1 hypothetical protein [Citrobacter braakii]HCB1496160.1 hypothetical protein [Citrobacter braakii]HCB1688371.1 hypothetical protein [Citrobacter braakii]